MKKNKLFLLLIFIIISCNTQRLNFKKENTKILNTVLNSYNDPICLQKETFFKHTSIKPNYLINHYDRVYNSSKESTAFYFFYKDVDGVITKKELKELEKKNLKWKKKEWKTHEILNQKDSLIINSNIQINCKNKRLLKISETIFTNDKNKAIILIKTLKNNTGSTFMKILKKENGNWIIKGGIPIGTIN